MEENKVDAVEETIKAEVTEESAIPEVPEGEPATAEEVRADEVSHETATEATA